MRKFLSANQSILMELNILERKQLEYQRFSDEKFENVFKQMGENRQLMATKNDIKNINSELIKFKGFFNNSNNYKHNIIMDGQPFKAEVVYRYIVLY